jgi:S1-C subfamily serine protease
MMDVENLNRTQIILLTLLVSFVTSIATGIVTVSLMQQAPVSVQQTISKVVEHTKEIIVPQSGPSVVTKETTVIVKESDAVTAAIDATSKSVLGVYQSGVGADGATTRTFIGWGIVLTNKGVIATDSTIISETGSYEVADLSGVKFTVKVLVQDEVVGIALLQAEMKEGNTYTFTPTSLEDGSKIRLGESVIAFGGKEKIAVATGIVSALSTIDQAGSGTTTSNKILGFIDASVAPAGGVRGAALVGLSGHVLGISQGDRDVRFVSSVLLAQKLRELEKPAEKKTAN